jgi:hypothetical protein
MQNFSLKVMGPPGEFGADSVGVRVALRSARCAAGLIDLSMAIRDPVH